MTHLFSAIIKASFQGSIVILAVVLLRLLLKRAPKRFICLLWLLACLRLALPFEIQSSLSLQPRLEDTSLSIQTEQPVQVPDILIQEPEGPSLQVPPPQSPTLPEGNWDSVKSESYLYKVEDGTVTSLTWTDIAAQIWFLGIAAMFTASVISYFRLKRRVREAYLIENGCFECPGLETAFVLGFLPPKIYLPTGLTDQEKKFIFDHENTHLARYDHWSKLLGYAVLSIHWFNPLVWIAYGLLCRDMELACDEHVVKYMSLPERKAYSAALLSCGSHTAGLAACPVAFGESNPKQRILNVLNYKRPTFWISLLAVIAVIFVAVCLLTSPENKEEIPEETELTWNLEMKATEVTPWGLTVEFIQQGPFQGYDRAELQFGTYYTLERQVGDSWEPVEMLPQEYETGWTLEAYIIKRDDTTTQRVLWSWLYGELPGGKYRIGKDVVLFRTTGDMDTEWFYAEFTIEETAEPAWSMDMTEEEYLAWCRQAVEELQNREQFHISETIAYLSGDQEYNRNYAAYWRDGENGLLEYYIPEMRTNADWLYYNGICHRRKLVENEEAVWDCVDGASIQVCEPWLCLLRWDNQPVVFEGSAQEGEELRVSVLVHATPPTLGWDDIQEYSILFCFDKAGTMTQAIMTAQRDNTKVTDDLRMETTAGTDIHSKMEAFAAQRPDAPQPDPNLTGEQWLEKCRSTMMDFWSAPEQYLRIENPDNPQEVSETYYISENGVLYQTRDLSDYTDICRLTYGDKRYIFEGQDFGYGNLESALFIWQEDAYPVTIPDIPGSNASAWEKAKMTFRDVLVDEYGLTKVSFVATGVHFTFYFLDGEFMYLDRDNTRWYMDFPREGTVDGYLAQMAAEAAASAGKRPETPNNAFYQELFARQADGHYAEQWVDDLFITFYTNPAEFIRQLSRSDRAEEIVSFMGYSLEIYGPWMFEECLWFLDDAGILENNTLELLKSICPGDFYAYRGTPMEKITAEAALEKCRTALKEYQNQGCWAIGIRNQFTGPGAMNPTSNQVWYIHGDDFWLWNTVPDDSGEAQFWDLRKDGLAFHRDDNRNSNWQEGSTNGLEAVLPWLITLKWEDDRIGFVEAIQSDISQLITLKIQGSPFGATVPDIKEFYVTFWFWPDGKMWKIEQYYTQEIPGGPMNAYAEITPEVSSPESAAGRIQQCYDEAILHIHGICNDPDCTDTTHDHHGIACTVEHCTNPAHGH